MSDPIPAIEHTTGFVSSEDGYRLYVQSSSPASPRGVVCIVHGLGEHSGRYDHVVNYLVEHEWACSTVDLRGHGRSEGRRVHVDSHGQWAIDLAALIDLAHERHGDLPKILLGHSMGGLIALVEATSRPDPWAGLVVSSPAVGTHPDTVPPPWLHTLATLLSRWVPKLLISSDLDSSNISRDAEVVAAYREDPLVTRKVSARWYTEILALQELAYELAPKLCIPALIMQSGEDRLCSPESTRRWSEAAPRELVQYVEWPELYHEMLNEPERGQVLEHIVSWLDRLLPRDLN